MFLSQLCPQLVNFFSTFLLVQAKPSSWCCEIARKGGAAPVSLLGEKIKGGGAPLWEERSGAKQQERFVEGVKKVEKKRATLAPRRTSLGNLKKKNGREKTCKNFGKKKSNPRLSASVALCPLPEQGQIVDQRLTLNESQRRTALTITTPRSSTRSFANDLAPRLSKRGLTLTRGDACRAPEGRYIDAVTTKRPPSFVFRGRGTSASSLLGGILT